MSGRIPKSNDELREKYFNEKKIEFETACDQGNASACFSLGEWYQLFGKDTGKAAEIYDQNCVDRKNGNSCFNLALLYSSGKLKSASSVDVKARALDDDKCRAAYFIEKACKFGNSQACSALASFKLSGTGCEQDTASGISLLENSCENNDAAACLKLGSLYLRPKAEYGIERDPHKAFSFIKPCCELGHPNCCQILAVMYRKGDGVEQNNELFEKYKHLTKRILKETGERMGVDIV